MGLLPVVGHRTRCPGLFGSTFGSGHGQAERCRKEVDRIIEMYRQIADWVHRSRRLLATAGVGVLGLMLGFHIAFGQNGMISYMHKRDESRKLQQQITDLQQENARISKQIGALKTDPKTIEREAREQLRYARPGEVIYTLPAPPSNNVPVQAQK